MLTLCTVQITAADVEYDVCC